MRYFRYSNAGKSPADILNIYKVLWEDLANYAKVIYKNRWEDALDLAFSIIINNYDSNKGELLNYATKVVRTCMIQANRKEVPYEFIEDVSDNPDRLSKKLSKSISERVKFDVQEKKILKNDESFMKCVNYLAPFFIKDFKFLASMKSSYRKHDYSELLELFDMEDIVNAIKYLKEGYEAEVQVFLDTRKACCKRKYNPDKENNIAPGIKYLQILNGTVLYYKTKNVSEKYFYYVDLNDAVREFLQKFYNSGKCGMVKVEDTVAYCSLTGVILLSLNELVESLKNDIAGILVTRENVRILERREDGLIILSNRELLGDIGISVFKGVAWVQLKQMPSKEVQRR